jgi:hypothetical protein
MLEGLRPLVGTVRALDNALCETTIGLYKTECVREGSPFRAGPIRTLDGTVNLSNPRAIFAGSPPRFTRSRVTYEAYVVSRTSTRPQVDSAY